jgi:hypothetical protein
MFFILASIGNTVPIIVAATPFRILDRISPCLVANVIAKAPRIANTPNRTMNGVPATISVHPMDSSSTIVNMGALAALYMSLRGGTNQLFALS